MSVQGRDCCITLKTKSWEVGLPFSEETIREAVSLLMEKAPIEGNGICQAIPKIRGVTGCVVTPLTLETAPLLFGLALGRPGEAVFVSETRNLYRHGVSLMPLEDGMCFDLVQERGNTRALYEGCRVSGFELRIERGEAIKIKMDITGDTPALVYPYDHALTISDGERYKEDGVTYAINGNVLRGIYGVTIRAHREGGIKTEVFIHRILDKYFIFDPLIENFTLTARLCRDRYEDRHFGLFRLNISRLVLMSDETTVNSGGEVIGPLRYYCAGGLSAEVFTSTGEVLE